jgi:hypothetical protein
MRCPASHFTNTSGSGCAEWILPDSHLIGAADANFEGGDTLDTTEAAQWWPFNAGQTLTATDGALGGTVSNAAASGTIHLVRQ